MWLFPLMLFSSAVVVAEDVSDDISKIEVTRAGISEDERRQREALSHLFVINKNVREIARKQEKLNRKLMAQEGSVRALAQDVQRLESQAEQQKEMLNRRLRQLYQERDHDDFHWMFSAQSPAELERNHRFLRLMIDSDHKQLKTYLGNLQVLKKKRVDLKQMVAQLIILQKEVQSQEKELAAQMREKSRFIADVKKSKDTKLSQLKDLRTSHAELNDVSNFAFFERKGALRAPVNVPVTREYGTYVDPQFRFRVMHKGLFYSSSSPQEVRAVHHGRVALASRMPGLGKTIILDHGDNYFSVYAFTSQLKVREGERVREGDLLGTSGRGSPLFGPGLYFEIRHFTDAIDPRPWIKDSVLQTARTQIGD